MDQTFSPPPAEPKSLIDTALEVHRKITVEGRTQLQVAAEHQKSPKWVRDMLDVAKLPENTLLELRKSPQGYNQLVKLAQSMPPNGNGSTPSGSSPSSGGSGDPTVLVAPGSAKESVISVGALPSTPRASTPMDDGSSLSSNGNGAPTPMGVPGSAKESVISREPLPRASKRSTPMGVAEEDSGHLLLRDSLNHFEEVFIFWRRTAEPKLGGLVERWLLYLGAKSWLKVGAAALVLGMAGVGTWQTVHYVRSHNADFVYRFKTAMHPSAPGAAAPHITDSHLVTSHRLELKWTAVPGALHYRVYWHTPDDHFIHPLGADVDTLGAVVDIHPIWKEGYVTVTGIAAGDIPSPHSEKIAFVTNGEKPTGFGLAAAAFGTRRDASLIRPAATFSRREKAYNRSAHCRRPSPSGRGWGEDSHSLIAPIHGQSSHQFQ